MESTASHRINVGRMEIVPMGKGISEGAEMPLALCNKGKGMHRCSPNARCGRWFLAGGEETPRSRDAQPSLPVTLPAIAACAAASRATGTRNGEQDT